MAQKVDMPFLGTEIDTGDWMGSAQRLILSFALMVGTIGFLAVAARFYNRRIAEPTGDALPRTDQIVEF